MLLYFIRSETLYNIQNYLSSVKNRLVAAGITETPLLQLITISNIGDSRIHLSVSLLCTNFWLPFHRRRRVIEKLVSWPCDSIRVCRRPPFARGARFQGATLTDSGHLDADNGSPTNGPGSFPHLWRARFLTSLDHEVAFHRSAASTRLNSVEMISTKLMVPI